ncbi:peptide chain release factor 1 [Thermocrinis minervae]|uniref:Peptide chain release factor subunit 1 n=1 Tax=Thermocrinis minervae TaxID=381751 RepID=A0A1M6SHX8_9AQUI|nr:peptide chain release factor 1 [Thermocrinis minervae]SHK44394.1 peptide chain release factor subunit 1 [Thermocrinis minervae]
MGLKEVLDKLTSYQPDENPIVSLYLRLMPEDRVDKKYIRVFKDLVKAKGNVPEEDVKRIGEFLENPENLKGCRGIAVFSCHKKDLFEVVKLPYVYRNRIVVNYIPSLVEIAAIDEEFGKVGIVLVDRKHVRFFVMDIETISEDVDFTEPLATRAHRFHSGGDALRGAQGMMRYSMPARFAAANVVQHGVGEYRFHTRLMEEKQRLFKLTNDALMEALKLHKFDKLVIGSIREDIREIENHLHTYLKQRLVGYIRINPSEFTEEELRDKVLDLLWQKDREQEEELYRELVELEGKGLAVNGTSKVLEQLNIGNVRTLLVPENFKKEGYFCPQSKILMLKPECPIEGENAVYLDDLVDEAIDMALEERAQVEVIIREDVAKRIDGLAAFLRYRI